MGAYILILYADKNREILLGYRLFSRIRDAIEWTGGLVKYADLNKPLGKYHTYKSYIALLELTNYESWKFFNCRFFDKYGTNQKAERTISEAF
jgi:hypothetical protein